MSLRKRLLRPVKFVIGETWFNLAQHRKEKLDIMHEFHMKVFSNLWTYGNVPSRFLLDFFRLIHALIAIFYIMWFLIVLSFILGMMYSLKIIFYDMLVVMEINTSLLFDIDEMNLDYVYIKQIFKLNDANSPSQLDFLKKFGVGLGCLLLLSVLTSVILPFVRDLWFYSTYFKYSKFVYHIDKDMVTIRRFDPYYTFIFPRIKTTEVPVHQISDFYVFRYRSSGCYTIKIKLNNGEYVIVKTFRSPSIPSDSFLSEIEYICWSYKMSIVKGLPKKEGKKYKKKKPKTLEEYIIERNEKKREEEREKKKKAKEGDELYEDKNNNNKIISKKKKKKNGKEMNLVDYHSLYTSLSSSSNTSGSSEDEDDIEDDSDDSDEEEEEEEGEEEEEDSDDSD